MYGQQEGLPLFGDAAAPPGGVAPPAYTPAPGMEDAQQQQQQQQPGVYAAPPPGEWTAPEYRGPPVYQPPTAAQYMPSPPAQSMSDALAEVLADTAASAPTAAAVAPPAPSQPQPVDGQLAGKETIKFGLGCMPHCFMLPFPFFCLGCCLFRSSELQLDDATQTLTWRSWPGYCCCDCCTREAQAPYANVRGLQSIINWNLQINNMPTRDLYLEAIGVPAQTIRLGVPDHASDIEQRAARVQQKLQPHMRRQLPFGHVAAFI